MAGPLFYYFSEGEYRIRRFLTGPAAERSIPLHETGLSSHLDVVWDFAIVLPDARRVKNPRLRRLATLQGGWHHILISQELQRTVGAGL